jgi:hypothetical protein
MFGDEKPSDLAIGQQDHGDVAKSEQKSAHKVLVRMEATSSGRHPLLMLRRAASGAALARSMSLRPERREAQDRI